MKTAGFFYFLLLSLVFGCRPDPVPLVYEPYEEPDREAILAKYLDLSKFPTSPTAYRLHLDRPFVANLTIKDSRRSLVDLGRVLFYDKNFSAGRQVSCASCHHQKFAFADSTAFSTGVFGQQTERNSFALASFLSFEQHYSTGAISSAKPKLFWDNRSNSIHDQVIETMANPVEMNISEELFRWRAKELEYYGPLMHKAYGDQQWEEETLYFTSALAAFMNSFSSPNSRFDRALKKIAKNFYTPSDFTDDFDSFSASENLGKKLFFANCASCHGQPLGFEINRWFGQFKGDATCNGLDVAYVDKGVGKLWEDPTQDGFFKIPSLKNIAVTAPYMHDGRFATLREVVEHYSTGVQPHTNLDPLLKDDLGNPKHLQLSEAEITALVDFLHTLTDEYFLTDDRWSDPFLR